MRQNWELAARRLRAGRARLQPIDRQRAAFLILAGIAVVVIVGVLFDARLIAWSRTLPPSVHGFFGWITEWGKSGWLLIPSGVVVIIVMLGDWRRVSRASAAAWFEIATFAAVLFVVVAATGLTIDAIKPIVGRFRPDYVAEGAFAFAPLSFGGYAHYSFPSGPRDDDGGGRRHGGVRAGRGDAADRGRGRLVAVSRVIIGVHFPSDVVGGALIGFGVGYLILRAMTAAGIVYAVRRGRLRHRFGTILRLHRRGGRLRSCFRRCGRRSARRPGGANQSPPPDPQ